MANDWKNILHLFLRGKPKKGEAMKYITYAIIILSFIPTYTTRKKTIKDYHNRIHPTDAFPDYTAQKAWKAYLKKQQENENFVRRFQDFESIALISTFFSLGVYSILNQE